MIQANSHHRSTTPVEQQPNNARPAFHLDRNGPAEDAEGALMWQQYEVAEQMIFIFKV